MIRGNRVGDVLQHDGLTRLGRGHEQAALTLADGRDHVDHAAGQVLFGVNIAFKFERLGRK